MCLKFTVLALACLSRISAQDVHSDYEDPAAAVHAGSKYFQDIYVAMESPNELEFGHVSETPSEWEQRFEKIDLANLQRQGKVRWGDKDGSYGEHYYDFNHDRPPRHHDDGEEETQQQPEYVAQETRQSPYYADYPAPAGGQRGKREQGLLKDVEFISDKAKSLILDGKAQKHGGNYRSAYDSDYDREKREEHKVDDGDSGYEPGRRSFRDKKRRYDY